jgi:PAS domain S-box-containing protein
MNAGFGVALAILMVIGYLYYLNVRAMTDFDRMVERSQAVILNLEGLLSAIKDVENGEHIFTITGDERSLEPYRAAIGQVDRYLETLNTLTKNHPAQQNLVNRVEPIIRERLAETAKTIDIRKREGYRAASQREFSGRHKFLTDEISRQLDEAQNLVMQHLDSRKALKEASTRNMILAVYAGFSLSFVLFLTIYVLIKKDIAKRKRTEAKFRGLLESAPEAVVIVNDKGDICLVNSQTVNLFGYEREELYGRKIEVLIIPERFRNSHVNHRADYFQDPRVRRMGTGRELFGHCKDGREIPVDISLSPLITDEGVLVIANIRDITAHKESEDEIRRLNTNLAARNAELEAANRELEAFNYTAAHDLRQPLNLISTYCQVINELCGDKLDEKCKEYLQKTYGGTMRMNQLIGALLKFSKIVHAELKRERVDLSSMAREVAVEVRQTEPERRVTFRIAEGITANGDVYLLRLVLSNLLGNAWKYTGKREEAVIEFDATENDGQPVYFVRDNGNGFDMADADKLFAPFQHLPGAEECRGFGIGLATVERIIRRHGGGVWAESDSDKGATFYFTLATESV